MTPLRKEESLVRNEARILLVVFLALMIGGLAIGIFDNVSSLIQSNRTINNQGSVKGIGVGIYWDSAATNQVSSVNWGVIDPGSSNTVTVYVKNQGNAVVTLSKIAQNWNPSTSSSYLTLNWDYSGQTLSANQVLQVRLTLVVSSTISGITNFTFDIVITATG